MIAIFEDMINSFVAFVHTCAEFVCVSVCVPLWYASFRSIFITAQTNVPGHSELRFGACAIGEVQTKQSVR